MDTKLRGDIAEQAAILNALQRGWSVLTPIGDILPYDIVFDIKGTFARVQVKNAWFDKKRNNYVIDTRRIKTNRRIIIRDSYKPHDFDFALIYIEELNLFYIFPIHVFITYGSEIHFVESQKRQRKPQSAKFRDAWNLISQWAAQHENAV